MIRRFAALAALAGLALALAACGEKQERTSGVATKQRLALALDRSPNATHAGIYAAIDGQLPDAGIDLRPRPATGATDSLELLGAGKVDLAIAREPELLLARADGAELVSIGALVQQPLTAIVSLDAEPIRRPEQLEGSKIGITGLRYERTYLRSILRGAGADPAQVRRVDVGSRLVPALLDERVDAVLGAFWNIEGVALRRRDRKPVILRVDDVGIPSYDELVVVARATDVRARGPLLRRLMRALARGHAALRDDVDVGADPLVRADSDLNRGLLRAQIRATLPAFFPADDKRPFGFHAVARWRRYAQWMTDNGLLASADVGQRAFTNEFLPGEGI